LDTNYLTGLAIFYGSGVKSLSSALPIFHESLPLTPGFFPENKEICYTATLLFPDWNICILWKLVNRKLQKERVKEVGWVVTPTCFQ
jgi:hypothetical protein